MADALGLELDADLALDMDVWLSPTTYTGQRPRGRGGHDRALRWSLAGVVAGRSGRRHHVNRIGRDAAPDWPKIGAEGGYRIEIDGMPPYVGEFPSAFRRNGQQSGDAVVMTAARCVNSIDASSGPSPAT